MIIGGTIWIWRRIPGAGSYGFHRQSPEGAQGHRSPFLLKGWLSFEMLWLISQMSLERTMEDLMENFPRELILEWKTRISTLTLVKTTEVSTWESVKSNPTSGAIINHLKILKFTALSLTNKFTRLEFIFKCFSFC